MTRKHPLKKPCSGQASHPLLLAWQHTVRGLCRGLVHAIAPLGSLLPRRCRAALHPQCRCWPHPRVLNCQQMAPGEVHGNNLSEHLRQLCRIITVDPRQHEPAMHSLTSAAREKRTSIRKIDGGKTQRQLKRSSAPTKSSTNRFQERRFQWQ